MANMCQNDGYIMLCKAIKRKDRMSAEVLIQNKVSVNIPNAKSNTPLHRAITQFEDLNIMEMLLNRGANVHVKNQHNLTPLDVAIRNRKTEAAILLINKGALVGEDLNALLLKAIENYNHIVFIKLIDHGMQYNILIDFNILFNAAISRGQAKITEYILPHRQVLKPSDRYIPKELMIISGQQCKECVQLLLKEDFTINPTSSQDKDFVYGAVKNGYVQIVLQLLKLGIDVNLVNSNTGLNLLKIACFNKHHEVVELLLKHSANVNETTPTNTKILDDPLYYYHENSYIATLSSTLNMKDLWGLTCLHIAVLNSDPVMTRLLLRYGAKIIDDPKFYKITSIAVKINCEEIVHILLDHGVDANDINFQGNTLLHFCVHSDCGLQDPRYNIAKLLLERGAIAHIQTPGNSLIFKAITNGHPKTAQLFLDFNANIQYIGPDGNTPLHMAIERDFDVEFIKTLLKLNAPVDAVNNYLLTPLLVTVKIKLKNQFEIIKVLLDHNANVNCTVDCANINSTDDILMKPISNLWDLNPKLIDCSISLGRGFYFDSKKNKGKTPLHFVCQHKGNMTESIIELLLQHNANIEAEDARGWTPLFEACYSHNDVAIKCLLDHDANADHIDLENVTPLYVAVKRRGCDPKIIEMLFERKVNLNCIDKEGKSMIHIFVENCNGEIIKRLIHTQLDFNSVDNKGNSPLHRSVRYERVDMIKSLIKYGANVNMLDKKNRTPLRNAIKYMSEFQDHFDKFRRRRFSRKKYSEDEDLDTDSFEDHINAYKKIIPILKTQVVKLKTAGLKVNKQNLKIVYNSDDNNSDRDIDCKIDVLQLEVKCEQEIEKMGMENIGVNTMTLYDLLQKNIHLLSRYVKNKQIQQKLELEVYDEKYPLYIDIVRSRFRDAKLRYKLMKPAKKYFSLNINHKLPDNCIDTVFSYLRMKDINMFLRAVKLLD